jgi:hypothetical protein
MTATNSTPWPPPPDLASIKELVRNADTEEFIANGSPSDEYDGEAEQLFTAIGRFATVDLVAPEIVPHIESIWSKSFAYDQDILARTRPSLEGLAQQIARFFGPEARPHVRERSE